MQYRQNEILGTDRTSAKIHKTRGRLAAKVRRTGCTSDRTGLGTNRTASKVHRTRCGIDGSCRKEQTYKELGTEKTEWDKKQIRGSVKNNWELL